MVRAPLTDSQRELAATAAGWIKREVRRCPEWVAGRIGWDGLEQEAWVAVVKAAHDYDPARYPGVPFGAFACIGVRRHMMGIRERLALKSRVWRALPVGEDGEQFLEPADHREQGERALHEWCSEEYSRQRKCLDWRRRLILYLRYVESWTLEEVGEQLRVSRERVRQLEEEATVKLAAFRNRERARKKLEGNP